MWINITLHYIIFCINIKLYYITCHSSHNSNLYQKDGEVEASVDVHFEPVIKLEQVETRTLEEEETTVFKM